MFHRATCTTVLASALLLSSPAGHADLAGVSGRGTGAHTGAAPRFLSYFGPGGKHLEPTIKFFEPWTVTIPKDWVQPFGERIAGLRKVRLVTRRELVKPGLASGLAWDTGHLLVNMSGDERRAFESTLGPGSQLAVPVQKMMIPPLVRISAGFPIAILIPNPDPSRDIDGDLYLVVQSPYPQSPFPPRYVAFGGTVEATEAQVDFLVRSCGARDFEGPKKRGPRGKMMTDLRFKAPAEKIPMIGQWLSSGRGPRDTHEREALEEFEEFGLLSEREARELLAANRGMPYRRLGKAVNRVGP